MALVVTLILAGILLLLAELLIIPGVGVAGFLGLASLAGSCWLAFAHFGNLTGGIVTLVAALVVVAIVMYALRGKTWKKAALSEAIDSSALSKESESLRIGDKGVTVTRLSPSGNATFGELTCEVKSLDNIIEAGAEVEIALIEDNKIFVKPYKTVQ